MSTIGYLTSALPLCLALAACSAEETPAAASRLSSAPESPPALDPGPVVPPADLAALVAGTTSFAIDLHGQLRDRPGNLFYSPFSLSEALAMSSVGARGATATSLASGLHFTLPPDRLHPAFRALGQALRPRPQGGSAPAGDSLEIASALWGQAGCSFEAPFLDVLARDYGADLRVADFAREPDRAIDLINQWARAQTHGDIDTVVDGASVTPRSRLVLTNAVYFREAWKYRFQRSGSRLATFVRGDGSTREVETMFQTRRLRRAEGPGWSAVELPYEDEALAMVAILPDAGAFDAFESSLTADGLAGIRARLAETRVDLSLPRFEIDASYELAPALTKLGMGCAFGPAADFSGISTEPSLALDAVVHRAHVKVDEAGTAAAATTAVGMVATSLVVGQVSHFDHPFLFFILHRPTGAILFVGRIVDPTAG